MTPEDVIWSMQALRDSHPFYNAYYKNITSVEKTGDHEVTFTFSEKGNRELPLITGQLPVLPKHWWTGKDANGKHTEYPGNHHGNSPGFRTLQGRHGKIRRFDCPETG